MKKLVSLSCCILYLDCLSHANPDLITSNKKATGERTLAKAIATVVGRETEKKVPSRYVELPADTRPY